MKKFLLVVPLLLLVGCRKSTPLTGGEPSLPASGVVAPTRDVYDEVSTLTFYVTGGFAGIDETLTVNGDQITYKRDRPAAQTTKTFSAAELRELQAVLRRAQFIKLAGKYQQKNLSDGFNETVTIQVGAAGKSKTYTVENYGDEAPAPYYEVTKFLRGLIARTAAQSS